MADNKDDDDSGEHTQFTPLRPPTLGQPPKKEEPKPAGDDKTMTGGAPPPLLKKPAAPPPPPAAPPPSREEEATDHTIADMPPPKPAAPPPPSSGGFEDEGATIVLAPSQRSTCSLQRIEPPGHGDVITLSRNDYLLGRSRTCDVPLYSSTASREHARLSKRGDSWYLTPEEGKTVIAGGSTVAGEVKLVHKMRLQLGGDELLFFDERAATAPAAARPATAVAGVVEKKGGRTGLVLATVAILIAIAAVTAYLLLMKP
jgi:pSer/pThr/pTyr-binding forkhead associated (FHA) protein